MPRKTPEQVRRRYFRLRHEDGLSQALAAEKVGISRQTAIRIEKGLREHNEAELGRKIQAELPKPKTWEDLTPYGQELLKNFDLFSSDVLCRRPAPWRRKAAEETVAAILDRSVRSYFVDNTPPGIGKSTLWTMDIPAWLVAGGGFCDPAFGRALRFMLGHQSKKVSEHYIMRMRRLMEMTRPYFDKEQRLSAKAVYSEVFGRFKPDTNWAEEKVWAKDQFLVAQMESIDLTEKEPTFQAASRQAGFLGERIDYVAWDDLVVEQNSRDPDIAEALNDWFEKEAETRVEPGGVLHLVGQRISPIDLFRKRLDKSWTDDDGNIHRKYHHIKFPAHNDSTCDGNHRQWDLGDDGCLLDEIRLPWVEIMAVRADLHYRTVYQQEDSDPESVLVLPIWIEGGTDVMGFDAPGCYDRERGFFEWPQDIGGLVDYVTVDPSASGWWAFEWWALHPDSLFNYLIFGVRKKMPAGTAKGLLDWDNDLQVHVGIMEDLQFQSERLGHPIKVWILEQNAFARHLTQYEHFRRWQQKYPAVSVLPHQTQKNKRDPLMGVEARLPMRYRNGFKRLPRKPQTDSLNYIRHKVQELTSYPHSATSDTVMADWFGETNIEEIIRLARRPEGGFQIQVHLAPYLKRQRQELTTRRQNIYG